MFCNDTNNCPHDDYTFFGVPELWIPPHKEVHVSCTFTWDKPKAEYLAESWRAIGSKVKIGGPAYNDPGGEFTPGMYTRKGITTTSRGCPNQCKFCFVPKREGKLRELEIKEGNEIQDNNFLACSKEHRRKVYDMLRTQRQIEFIGGLEAARLTDWDLEEIRKLRIAELWFACDTPGSIKLITKTFKKLIEAGFTTKDGRPDRDKLRCYTLIGDDMEENLNRLIAVYNAGALPYAQLYQPEEKIEYSKEWKKIQKTWSRPASTKAYMREKGETDSE